MRSILSSCCRRIECDPGTRKLEATAPRKSSDLLDKAKRLDNRTPLETPIQRYYRVYFHSLFIIGNIRIYKKFFIFNHSIRLSIFLKMVNNICLEETVYFLLIHANILCSEISFLMIPRWFLAWRFFRTVYFTRGKNGSSVRNV